MYDHQKKILRNSADIAERQTRAARHLQAEELKRGSVETFRRVRHVLSHMFDMATGAVNRVSH